MRLRDYAKSIGLDVGCQDSGCVWGPVGGMMTQGGCQCLKEHGNTATFRKLRLAAGGALADVARLEAEIAILRAEVDTAWAATGAAHTVRGLTTLDDVVATQRKHLRAGYPVVEAARAWRSAGGPSATWNNTRVNWKEIAEKLIALTNAVDVYEAEQEP